MSLRKLGHEAVLIGKPSGEDFGEAAIVNLGSVSMPPAPLIAALKAKGIAIIAHAGHKEKDLLALGKSLDCEILATNSELTFKLPELLQRVSQPQPS